ncbi:Exocyst complex component 2 [Trichinella pseudospiralis]|uniref:Exocyst complex component 2 n=1 Tax=Trichinella pseudospiralis TaxID=6337 RepID=A0A0V1IIB4_TRIPS|nr:Exocyst complex component 2 [Trichinella pseudospiralis]
MKGPAPIVTGLSPKDGVPGTQIVIRGEHLGLSQSDVIGLTVCNADCMQSLKWESSHKIITRVSHCKAGTGEIIVTTKSGGRGSCTVQFRIFHALIGPLQPTAVWVDESRMIETFRRDPKEAAAIVDDCPLGFSIETNVTPLYHWSSELFPESSSNMRLENFHPVRYLVENCRIVSFENLKAGLEYMRSQVIVSKKGPKEFMKSNLSCILDYLRLHVEQDCCVNPTEMAEQFQTKIDHCIKTGEDVFVDVLKRKEQSDAIRNALALLQRFRFMFYLPQLMKIYTEKGEYALVLSEYSRAKSLLSETDVPLFKEAFAEAEIQMEEFKSTLHRQLVDHKVPLSEQKRIIRYLTTVDSEVDAGWICLESQCQWLKALIIDCQKIHFTIGKEKTFDDSENDFSDKLVSQIPQNFRFSESLCAILDSKVQDFVKLSQEYIAGQLTSQSIIHTKQVEDMILDIFNLSAALIFNAIFPLSKIPSELVDLYDDAFLQWNAYSIEPAYLLQLLKSLRSTVATFLNLECEERYLQYWMDLCVEIRLHCLACFVEQTESSISALASKEIWKLLVCNEEMSKTALPDLFESIIQELLPIFKQLLCYNNYRQEVDFLSSESHKVGVLKRFETLLCSFKLTMLKLIGLEQQQQQQQQQQQLDDDVVSMGRKLQGSSTFDFDYPRGRAKKSSRITDKKLLIVLANCDYLLRYCLPRLIDRLSKNGMWLTEPLQQRCVVCYGSFRTFLLKLYISSKSSMLNTIFEISADSGQKLQGVSNYIKDLILRIVSVQAELFLISPALYSTVIGFVIRSYSDRIIQCAKANISSFNHSQHTQLLLDFTAFEESVQPLLSDETKSMIKEFKLQIRSTWNWELQEMLNTYLQGAEILLTSLKQPMTINNNSNNTNNDDDDDDDDDDDENA